MQYIGSKKSIFSLFSRWKLYRVHEKVKKSRENFNRCRDRRTASRRTIHIVQWQHYAHSDI